MTGYRQQKPKNGLTKCPDLVDHYRDSKKTGEETHRSFAIWYWLEAIIDAQGGFVIGDLQLDLEGNTLVDRIELQFYSVSS